MARFDKYGNQLFTQKMTILPNIVVEKNELDVYVGRRDGFNIAFENLSVDPDDGFRGVPKEVNEMPNMPVMLQLGVITMEEIGTVDSVLVKLFEAIGTEEYKTANASYYVTPPVTVEE